MVDGVNFFNQNQEIKLQNRGARSSGITFELKSVFEDLVNKGVIRDKDGKGLTKADALNLFNKLDSIHKNTNRATNYTSMQAGQSFTYSAAEMKALAEAAGYEIVNSSSSQDEAIDGGMLPEVVVTAEKPKQKIIMPELPNPAANPDDIEIEIPQELKQASTESMIERLGGKIIEREVNGEGQQIAVVEINGQKIRRVINEDGSLGDTLAATKTFGKNEYISGDFPPETRIMEREVNGQKSQIGVYEDENGNKVRRLVVTDDETGKTTLGETLVTVSTMGKNKYVTQSKFEADVRSMLGLGANDEIPSDLKAEYVTIGGESSLVIKKDGKVMDSAQIRAYMSEYNKSDNNPDVYVSNVYQNTPTTGEDGPIINEDVPQTQIYQGRTFSPELTAGERGIIINNDVISPAQDITPNQADSSLDGGEHVDQNRTPVKHSIQNENVVGNYSIVPDGQGGYKLETNISLFGGGEAKEFFKTMSIGLQDKVEENNGTYSFRGVSSNSRQGLEQVLRNISNTVSLDNAIYKDLLSKQQSGVELSDVEKKFMEDHLESLKQYNLGVDAQGNLIDTTQETHRRRGRR